MCLKRFRIYLVKKCMNNSVKSAHYLCKHNNKSGPLKLSYRVMKKCSTHLHFYSFIYLHFLCFVYASTPISSSLFISFLSHNLILSMSLSYIYFQDFIFCSFVQYALSTFEIGSVSSNGADRAPVAQQSMRVFLQDSFFQTHSNTFL